MVIETSVDKNKEKYIKKVGRRRRIEWKEKVVDRQRDESQKRSREKKLKWEKKTKKTKQPPTKKKQGKREKIKTAWIYLRGKK